MLLLPRPRNPLAFPAGRSPGYNPDHLIAGRCFFSACAADNYYNRAVSQRASLANGNNTIQFGIDGTIGPWGKCSTVGFGNDANYFRYTGISGYKTDGDGFTVVSIQRTPPTADGFVAATVAVHKASFGSTGHGLIFFSSFGLNHIINSSGSTFSGITIDADTPYFVASSNSWGSPGRAVGVVRNLLTGKLQVATPQAPNTTSPSDIDVVNIFAGYQDTASSRGGNVKHAAVMFTNRFNDIDMLSRMSLEPWDFWYPPPRPMRPRVYGGAIAVEFLRPDSDDADGSWTNESGSNVNMFQSIDEAAPPNDLDFIQSSANPTTDIVRFRLSDPVAGIAEPFKVRYRYSVNSTTTSTLKVRLKQGGSLIKEWTHTDATTTPVTVTQTLSGGEFASISDPTNLFIEFEATAP